MKIVVVFAIFVATFTRTTVTTGDGNGTKSVHDVPESEGDMFKRDNDNLANSTDHDLIKSDDNITRFELATPSAVMNAAFRLGSVLNATSTIESIYPNWVAVFIQKSLSLSAWSVYGDMTKWSKRVQVAIKCTKYMISLSKSLVKYARFIKVYNPEATEDKILATLYRIDNVIIDIPVSISYCLGNSAADDVKFADMVLTTAEYALREIVVYGSGITASWTAFTKFMKKIALGDSIYALNETDITSLKSALKSDSTCGYDMKRLLDRAWMTVAELRQLNPEISEDDIRVIMN
ncbi:unnamed protein product [Peronospora destructor]|uniref:Uncharacterized protein n=2 Tax=Peronospora destructor TaxID=86335 RepID=A0AAV0T045_9STRA|nr:unnamed protein product [Peronospora destructor]